MSGVLLDVALTPRLLSRQPASPTVAIVVDALRATSIAALVAEACPDAIAALQRSATADVLRRARSTTDIAFCARIDATTVVPALIRPGASRPVCPVTLTDPFLEQAAA